MKTCTQCKSEKPIEEFRLGGVASNGKRYRASDCNECHRASSRAYRDANLEARRAAERRYARENAESKRAGAKTWYYANRERALAREAAAYARDPEYKRDHAHKARAVKAGSPNIEFVRRRLVYERDEGVCHLCGEFVEWEDYEMDHVVALSRGGDHTYGNVKTSHGVCNRGRRKMQRDVR